jgi:guanylate kinase
MESGIARRGLMLVLSSPSGAGKTTIASQLIRKDPSIKLSVSCTTRAKRRGEKEGKHYYFASRDAFLRMRDRGDFLEWAEVFGNLYGTPRKAVEQTLSKGRDVLFDVDWQGARKLRKIAKDDVVAVFILPPSARALEERLEFRAKDPEEVVYRRMRGAGNEIRHWKEYDYIVVNYDLEKSVGAVLAILKAERLRRSRQTGLKSFVQTLLAKL